VDFRITVLDFSERSLTVREEYRLRVFKNRGPGGSDRGLENDV
jgi:hypothetical protein